MSDPTIPPDIPGGKLVPVCTHETDNCSDPCRNKKQKTTQDNSSLGYKNDKNQRLDEVNLYDEKDTGLFRVHIEYIEKDSTKDKEISKIRVGQILQKELKCSYRELKKFGKRTITVYFGNYQLANDLVLNKNLNKWNLKAYIPRSYIFVTGIVRGVDEDVDLEDFKFELEKRYAVSKIERMTRLDKESGKRIDTRSVKVMFRSNKVPEYLIAYNMKIEISPFVGTVKQCRKCLRYGHFQDQCKSRNSKCRGCGLDVHQKEDLCVVMCIHCKQNHPADYPHCEERQRQKNIKILMAKNNIGYFEAIEQHPTYTQNQFSLLENLSDFPEIPKRRKYSEVTKVTPRTRLMQTESTKRMRERKMPEPIKEMTVADQTKNPLGGKAINFENPHKVSELEKVTEEFRKSTQSSVANFSFGSKAINSAEVFKYEQRVMKENSLEWESSKLPDWNEEMETVTENNN